MSELPEVMANSVQEFAGVRHDWLVVERLQPAMLAATIWSMLTGRAGISRTT